MSYAPENLPAQPASLGARLRASSFRPQKRPSGEFRRPAQRRWRPGYPRPLPLQSRTLPGSAGPARSAEIGGRGPNPKGNRASRPRHETINLAWSGGAIALVGYEVNSVGVKRDVSQVPETLNSLQRLGRINLELHFPISTQ